MSRRTITVCDRHGSEEVRADETVVFHTAQGKHEIDLCPECVEAWRELEGQLNGWIALARLIEAAPGATRRPGGRTATERLETGAIRAWAQSQGLDLGDRGRIPAELRQRFHDELGVQARERWTAVARQHRAHRRNGRTPTPESEHVGAT